MSLYDLPNIISIKNKKEITQLLETGEKRDTRFGIFFLAKNEKPEKQIAVLVKRSIGNAVKRNYFKRLVREYIRINLNKFSDYNKIIFVINKKIDVTFAQLKLEFDQKIQL
jgi:ribonuclease P protein component